MNLQKTSHIIIEQQPRSFSPINQDRSGRHFRKSMIGKKNYESAINIERMPYPQKVKYEDLDRKIQMLQM